MYLVSLKRNIDPYEQLLQIVQFNDILLNLIISIRKYVYELLSRKTYRPISTLDALSPGIWYFDSPKFPTRKNITAVFVIHFVVVIFTIWTTSLHLHTSNLAGYLIAH